MDSEFSHPQEGKMTTIATEYKTRLKHKEKCREGAMAFYFDKPPGLESCDYSQLTTAESKQLARAEHQRNYQACLTGIGYCDRSLLTPVERRSIPPAHASVPVADEK
jgi:hypothetical protein